MKLATVVYSAATKSMKKTFETVITPQNLVYHFGTVLNYFGYQDIEHVHKTFVNTHGNAANFIASFSILSEHPFLKFFKEKDTNRHNSPYFHDWAQEQKRLNDIRQSNNGGRRLLQMAHNEDKNVPPNTGSSAEAFGSFTAVSTLDCQSSPKNPLCIPEIPADFTLIIPTINLSKKQEKTIMTDINLCSPWMNTYCVICWKRYFNAFQEFRFLISAIPPVNDFFSTTTTVAPWTGIFFNWMFAVPKYHTGTLFQWVCFTYHLYDVFIVGVSLWLSFIFLRPFWEFIVTMYDSLKALKLDSETEPIYQKQFNRMEMMWKRMKKYGHIQSQIGNAYNPYTPTTQHPICHHCIDGHKKRVEEDHQTNHSGVIHHHHYQHGGVDNECDHLRSDFERHLHEFYYFIDQYFNLQNGNDTDATKRHLRNLLRRINKEKLQLDSNIQGLDDVDLSEIHQLLKHHPIHSFGKKDEDESDDEDQDEEKLYEF